MPENPGNINLSGQIALITNVRNKDGEQGMAAEVFPVSGTLPQSAQLSRDHDRPFKCKHCGTHVTQYQLKCNNCMTPTGVTLATQCAYLATPRPKRAAEEGAPPRALRVYFGLQALGLLLFFALSVAKGGLAAKSVFSSLVGNGIVGALLFFGYRLIAGGRRNDIRLLMGIVTLPVGLILLAPSVAHHCTKKSIN